MLKDAFVHSLSASLKLSTAVAAAGVVIALVMLRGSRAPAHAARSRGRRADRPQARLATDLALRRPIASAAGLEPRPTGGMRSWHRQM